jgi:MarR family transcriptional regulator, organic hydroperoxide resistance regulator
MSTESSDSHVEEATLSLEDLLCLNLYAASRAVIKAYRPFLEPLGLTYPQYLVMVALGEKEPLSVKELSERLNLDSGTLSPLLKRLESAGLVIRQRSSQDERGVDVHLTGSGRELATKAPSVHQGMGCLVNMELKEVRDLQNTLRKLIAQIEQD